MVAKGTLPWGDKAAIEVSARFAGSFASAAALKALHPTRRTDEQLACVLSPLAFYVFRGSSSAAASASILVPDAGSGRWELVGGGGGGGVKAPKQLFAKWATAAALPAYTRTGNVLLANANGALAAQDGIT